MFKRYFNVYTDLDGKGLIIESRALGYDDAVCEIGDRPDGYKFTIAIDLESMACEATDLSNDMTNYSGGPERLTGHEMGVAPGRV